MKNYRDAIELFDNEQYDDAIEKIEYILPIILSKITELQWQIDEGSLSDSANEISLRNLEAKRDSCENRISIYKAKIGGYGDNSGQSEQLNQEETEKYNNGLINEDDKFDIEPNDSINYTDPKYNYLTDTIPLFQNNDTAKINYIRRKVKELFDSLQPQKNRHHTSSEVQIINNKWLKETVLFNYEWFSGLKKLESDFLGKMYEYNADIRHKEELEIQKTIYEGEIQNYDIKIESEEVKLNSTQHIIDSVLADELRSKLRTIPNSIVLIGRIKTAVGFDKDTLGHILEREMHIEAIKKIKGMNLLVEKLSQKEQITKIFKKTITGRAITIDDYYKDLNQALTEEVYLYKIYRIEVFPFDNVTSDLANDIGNVEIDTINDIRTKFDVTVFEADIKNKILINIEDTIYRGPYHEHRFENQEEVYLNFQYRYSESSNTIYTTKMLEAITDYKDKLEYYQKEQKEIERYIEILREDKSSKENSLKRVEKELVKLDTDSEDNKKNIYIRAKEEYEGFYDSKEGYINKLAVFDASVDSDPYIVKFQNLVNKCFERVNDQHLSKNQVTIYRESNENEGLVKYEKRTIVFEPEADMFRILSMNIYEEKKIIYVSLNLAFRIKWTSKLKTELQWMAVPEEATSFNVFSSAGEYPIGYRLPSLLELEFLIKNQDNDPEFAAYLQRQLNEIYDGETLCFLSNLNFYENNLRRHRCISYKNKNTYSVTPVADGEPVYIIMVKEIKH
jgi:hypothetical protein